MEKITIDKRIDRIFILRGGGEKKINVYAGKSVSLIIAVENQENAYVFIFSVRSTA